MRIARLLACWLALGFALALAQAQAAPLAGTSLWVAQATAPQALVERAELARARTLIVKAGEGTSAEAQFTPSLVAALQASGLSVCAWTFVYGEDPAAEAAVALQAVADGAQCLVVDAEGQYDKRYASAQDFVHALRAKLGARFPIALAGQAEVLEHPTFPYSVFLGPGGFSIDMPQAYWHELGLSVSAALSSTLSINSIYGRPMVPLGQLFDGVAPSEVEAFWVQAEESGSLGWSMFDLDSAEPALLTALTTPTVLPALRRLVSAPTIRPGADGDEVVWAQELLNGAGARLPVGGFFGAQTARAVERFQRRHRLHVNGLLDPGTWRALLRYHAREPSWAKAPPDSADQ